MTLTTHITEDLKRLARLAANITDAHTCAILLPTSLSFPQNSPSLAKSQSSASHAHGVAHSRGGGEQVEQRGIPTTSITTLRGAVVQHPSSPIELKRVVSEELGSAEPRSIDLVALQSLSSRSLGDVRLQVGVGLLGWVAEHGRPIHIAPFDLDSTSLGLYSENEPIKCLAAVPIPIQIPSALGVDRQAPAQFGVLMCDSKKAFSFTKIQIKHLEELAPIIGRLVFWAHRPQPTAEGDSSWSSFVTRSQRLADAIGVTSVEILRVQMSDLQQIEDVLGVSAAITRSEQFVRLLQQALPPHFPVTKLASAEVLITVDNMMSNFFQNKIKILAERLAEGAVPFNIQITSHAQNASHVRSPKDKKLDIDAVVRQRMLAVHSNQSVVSGGNRA
jgi:hypothetical protein